jgi:hypothetical protein
VRDTFRNEEKAGDVGDNLWANLEPVSAAASKRPSMADQPSKQPMKAGIKPAQQKAPTADQKRHRRQMSKKAGGWTPPDDENNAECPNCGAWGQIGVDFTDNDGTSTRSHDTLTCGHCGVTFDRYTGTEVTDLGRPNFTSTSSTNQKSPTKESTMTSTQPNTGATEADLMARLAAATTLTQQAALSAQIDELRASQREASLAEGSLDWGAMDTPYEGPTLSALAQAAQSYAGVENYAGYEGETFGEHLSSQRLSHESDWLMDMDAPEMSADALHTSMRAEATTWFENGVYAPVKDSPQEFSVQAHNAAARSASRVPSMQREAAASVFLAQVDHLYRKEKGITLEAAATTSAWGADPMRPGPDPTIDTYVSDGKDSLPVGVDPAKADTFDEHTLPGADGNAGTDPKSTSTAGDAPSLSEGTQPEGDKSEGSENPLTGTDQDKSTYDVGNTEDKMKTQGGLDATAGFFENKPQGGGMDWDSMTDDESKRSQAEREQQDAAVPMTSTSALDQMFASLRAEVTADAMPSTDGLGEGIDEGETPEGDHSEPPTQNNGEGAKDMSGDGQGWPTNPGTGGTGDATSGAAPGTPYHSSLSANAQIFAEALSNMAMARIEEIGGVTKHQVVAALLADDTVPAEAKEALKAGGNPFGREAARKEVTAARECQWTRISEPGEDDGLTWWHCSTHDKDEMGGEDEEPSFPCEGWLDENAAENPYPKRAVLQVRASDPDWLRERVNDPYGTPNKDYVNGEYVDSKFWSENTPTQIGDYKVIEKDGKWYAYHTRQNYWMTLSATNPESAKAEVEGMDSKLDMWASLKTAAVCHYCMGDGLAASGEKCPVCNGTGKEPKEKTESSLSTTAAGTTCRTCGETIAKRQDPTGQRGMAWATSDWNADNTKAGDDRDFQCYDPTGRHVPLRVNQMIPSGKESSVRVAQKATIEDYDGPGECYVGGCGKKAAYRASGANRDSSLACSSHIGDAAGNIAKSSSLSPQRLRLAIRTTAISLTNVGIEGENGVGTAPDGTRVTFKVTPKELADLKSVLYSDMAMNFSGVDIDASDIISQKGGGNDMTSPARTGKVAYEIQDLSKAPGPTDDDEYWRGVMDGEAVTQGTDMGAQTLEWIARQSEAYQRGRKDGIAGTVKEGSRKVALQEVSLPEYSAYPIQVSSACAPGGDGQCDGFDGDASYGGSSACQCPCHSDWVNLPSSVADVTAWHRLMWNTEGESLHAYNASRKSSHRTALGYRMAEIRRLPKVDHVAASNEGRNPDDISGACGTGNHRECRGGESCHCTCHDSHYGTPNAYKKSSHTASPTDTRSDYEKGKERGYVDHSSRADLSHPDKVDEWNGASDEFKKGWSEGYEQSANMSSRHSVPKQREGFLTSLASGMTKVAVIQTGTWNGAPAEFIPHPGGLAVTVRLPQGHPELGYAPGSEFMENSGDSSIAYDPA